MAIVYRVQHKTIMNEFTGAPYGPYSHLTWGMDETLRDEMGAYPCPDYWFFESSLFNAVPQEHLLFAFQSLDYVCMFMTPRVCRALDYLGFMLVHYEVEEEDLVRDYNNIQLAFYQHKAVPLLCQSMLTIH